MTEDTAATATTAQARPRDTRRWLSLAVKLAVSLGVLAAVVLMVDVRALWDRLGTVSPWLVAGLVAMMLGTAVLQGLRWRLVLALAEGRRRRFPAVRIVMLSLFFLLVMPSVLGADAVRAVAAGRAGVAARDAIASVMVDRLVALAVLVALGLCGLPILFALSGGGAAAWSMAALLSAAVAGYAVLLALGSLPQSWRRRRLVAALLYPVTLLRVLAGRPRRLSAAVGLSALIHCGSLLILSLLAVSMGITASVPTLAAVGVSILIVTMLPVSIAGWGVREGAAVVAYGLVGAAPEAAVAASLLFGVVMAVTGLLGGLIWLAGDLVARR